MKHILSISAIVFLFTLWGCEEDVVLKLGQIEKRMVVEANVSNLKPVTKVVLSYSKSFYDTLSFNLISDADVEISTGSGISEKLTWSPFGYYYSKTITPVAGESYTLKILNGDQQVEATTTMPSLVKIKQVLQVPNPFYENNDSINLFVYVDDPKGEDDFFRLKIYRYGTVPSSEYFLMDDSFGKDGVITMPVYYKNFALGDTVVVELYHLTKDMYEYYNGLSDNISGSFNSIAPGNPVSNMPDEVYGYFTAFAVDCDTVVVGAIPKNYRNNNP